MNPKPPTVQMKGTSKGVKRTRATPNMALAAILRRGWGEEGAKAIRQQIDQGRQEMAFHVAAQVAAVHIAKAFPPVGNLDRLLKEVSVRAQSFERTEAGRALAPMKLADAIEDRWKHLKRAVQVPAGPTTDREEDFVVLVALAARCELNRVNSSEDADVLLFPRASLEGVCKRIAKLSLLALTDPDAMLDLISPNKETT